MRFVLVAVAALLLAGCSTRPCDPKLAHLSYHWWGESCR